jgi:hypothetical protein
VGEQGSTGFWIEPIETAEATVVDGHQRVFSAAVS